MAYTGANILTEVRARDESYDSTTYGAGDLQQAQDWVCSTVTIYPDDSEDFLMVANQKEYAFNANTLRMLQVIYKRDANDVGIQLQAVSVDQLDQDYPTWRTDPSSTTPSYYCDRGGELILYPAPSASSVGGYPLVRVYSSRTATLSSGTTLPTIVRNINAWVCYILYINALRFYPSQSDGWLGQAEMWRTQLGLDGQKTTYRKKPRISSRLPFIRYV